MTAGRYALEFRPAAVRQLRQLPRDAQRRLRAAIEPLGRQPRPPGAVKLAGTDDLWRIRVVTFG